MEALGVIVLVLFSIVGFMGLGVLAAILRGWIITKFWVWFIIPLGTLLGMDIPPIPIALAIGLTYVYSIISGDYANSINKTECANETQENKQKRIITNTATVILTPFIMLFFGWIVHMFI